jgi:hypothetical protein
MTRSICTGWRTQRFPRSVSTTTRSRGRQKALSPGRVLVHHDLACSGAPRQFAALPARRRKSTSAATLLDRLAAVLVLARNPRGFRHTLRARPWRGNSDGLDGLIRLRRGSAGCQETPDTSCCYGAWPP